MRLTHYVKNKDERKNKEPMVKIRNKLFAIENILEKYGIYDLKVLDEILEVNKFLLEHNYKTMPKEDFDLIFKKLEALEIMKKKFYFEWLFVSNGVEQFNEAQDNEENKLTNEEYELLRKVLL